MVWVVRHPWLMHDMAPASFWSGVHSRNWKRCTTRSWPNISPTHCSCRWIWPRPGWREFEQIAAAIEREFGRLDGLLHSAATLGTLTPLALYDLETWQRVMQVNFNAAYLLTRACLGALEKSPDASVIFTTSEMARQGRAYWGPMPPREPH